MTELAIGDRVRLSGRVFLVRGFSPMGVSPRRLHLQALDSSGEWLEVDTGTVELERLSGPEAAPGRRPADSDA